MGPWRSPGTGDLDLPDGLNGLDGLDGLVLPYLLEVV